MRTFAPSGVDALPLSHPAQGRRPKATGRIRFGADGSEHRCEAARLSADEVTLQAPVRARVGERAVCYLDEFGRLEGRVSAVTPDGLALSLALPPVRRARLEAQLERCAGRVATSTNRLRGFERLTPRLSRAVLTIDDGRRIAVRIANLSRSGAALASPIMPLVGSSVRLGDRDATVIRVTPDLVAIAFMATIPADAFSAHMAF